MGETEQGQGDTVSGHSGPSWWPVRTDAQFWQAVRQDPERHGFSAEQAEKLSAFFLAGGRREQTPEQRAREVIGWFNADSVMDAEHWRSMSSISPEQAAMLLCQFNPNTDGIASAMRSTNDETNPQDFIKLRQRLEDLASSEPRVRNLRDWFDVATAHRLKHHSWIGKYFEALRIVVEARPEASSIEPDSAKPPQPADDAAEIKRWVQPTELLNAFAPFLTPGRFDKLEGWLLDARRRKGIEGRGGTPALFCPYAVMVGLTTRARKKRMPQSRGWQVLREKFPDTFKVFEDKRPRTGDDRGA